MFRKEASNYFNCTPGPDLWCVRYGRYCSCGRFCGGWHFWAFIRPMMCSSGSKRCGTFSSQFGSIRVSADMFPPSEGSHSWNQSTGVSFFHCSSPAYNIFLVVLTLSEQNNFGRFIYKNNSKAQNPLLRTTS